MKAFLVLVLLVVLSCDLGCKHSNSRLNGLSDRQQPVPEQIIDKIVDSDAGKEAAKQMWGGFIYAGGIGLIAGIAALWFTDSWKVLAAGAAIAAIPPVATLLVYPLLPWFAAFSLVAGVMLLAYFGYVLYDRVEDDVIADRADIRPDQSGPSRGAGTPAPSGGTVPSE